MVEVFSPTPISKAGATPPVPKLELNFFDDCSVAELAKKINLDLSGTLKPPKKSRKEPITDANNNPKEAIKTKLYTAHKFTCGSTLSGNQPFIADAMAEVAERRQQQAFAAESARHLSLLASLQRLAPDAKYVNRRPVPVPPPSPKPLPPSTTAQTTTNPAGLPGLPHPFHSSWSLSRRQGPG